MIVGFESPNHQIAKSPNPSPTLVILPSYHLHLTIDAQPLRFSNSVSMPDLQALSWAALPDCGNSSVCDQRHLPGKGGRGDEERCRVQFAAGVAASQRVRSAAESLKDSAEVRVTAEQSANGEWVATDILILKLPEVDKVRLRI
jgi:hypothetical protein